MIKEGRKEGMKDKEENKADVRRRRQEEIGRAHV